jgi:hypothetical protein
MSLCHGGGRRPPRHGARRLHVQRWRGLPAASVCRDGSARKSLMQMDNFRYPHCAASNPADQRVKLAHQGSLNTVAYKVPSSA